MLFVESFTPQRGTTPNTKRLQFCGKLQLLRYGRGRFKKGCGAIIENSESFVDVLWVQSKEMHKGVNSADMWW